MINTIRSHKLKAVTAVFMSAIFLNSSYAEVMNPENDSILDNQKLTRTDNSYYVATNNSVQQLFYVLGGALNKPIIVSTEAAKKRISGNFDLSKPKSLLSTLTAKTGLIWYDDGSSIYVYDSAEIKSSVIRLAYAPFERLVAYLQGSGLYDNRFPLRSNGSSGSFYVSGPPVYVELITAAAKYIDATYSKPGAGETMIRVIKLKNSFVNDRSYIQRGAPITIPGVASVLNQLLNGNFGTGRNDQRVNAKASITVDNDTRNALQAMSANQTGNFPPLPAFNQTYSTPIQTVASENDDYISIVAYSDTNSLLVRGSARQVNFVEDLVNAIDLPKQQIQLSLWIIDISKDDVNELGVRWQAAAKVGDSGITFNTSSLTPQSSAHFLADVSALARTGNAQIVSRPEILTQENIPALFDNNSSFYAKLVGERSSSLEKVTFGTMISVLPRLAQRNNEIEMVLNIQDGGLATNPQGNNQTVDSLPIVHNTQISTEARVPVGFSLLVGGYSRDQDEDQHLGIPGLKDIPYLGRLFGYHYTSNKKMIRLFLIQPRLMKYGETWQGEHNINNVLGRDSTGDELTLKSTVSMLRNSMNK